MQRNEDYLFLLQRSSIFSPQNTATSLFAKMKR